MSDQRNLNSGKLAKNTLALYIRMLFSMAVGLYTSRVVLNILGVSDFGIYNVVGSIVTLFSFVNGSMSLATSRFLTFELGQRNNNGYKNVFRTSLSIHLIIALVIFTATELVGLWFIDNKLLIPAGRLIAAQWVFQLSLLSCVVSIIFIPYNSAIIAYERMAVYAWFSIIDIALKLLVVFLLYVIPFDKLIVYAILIFLVTLFTQLLTFLYCLLKIDNSRFCLQWDKAIFLNMFSFAGWTVIGQLASVGFTQGLNMLLNVFFGPAVNAARGIAVQVQSVIYRFITSFQTAVNPQITKTYASNEMRDMHKLIYASSKFSFYLLLIISAPVILEAPYLLRLWLNIVPEYTVEFFRIIILVSFVDTLANPLIFSNMATGEVKYWNIICGSVLLLILPVSYFCLVIEMPAVTVFIVHFVVAVITQIIRLFFLRQSIKLSIKEYIHRVILPTFEVTVVTISFGWYILSLFCKDTLSNVIIVILVTIAVCIASVFFIGITRQERCFFISKVKSKIFHK